MEKSKLLRTKMCFSYHYHGVRKALLIIHRDLSINLKLCNLLVTSARCDEEQQHPFPELIPWKTINGHVGKVSP